MSQARIPVVTEVGKLYDRIAGFKSEEFGGNLSLHFGHWVGGNLNLHFGYWDGPDDASSLECAEERLTELAIEKILARPSGRVLDVGCGLGTPAIRLARATGGEVVGITVSHEQVKQARIQAAAEGLGGRLSFQYADAASLPFAADSFDAAWALESIIHMPDRGQVLREIARVVRPGGRIVLTDFFERAPIPEHKRPVVDKFYSSWVMGPMVRIDDYPPLVREAGLRLIELVDISEQVMKRTVQGISQRISQDKQSLDDAFGTEIADDLDFADLADVWEFGYLLLVAELPGIDEWSVR